MIYLAINLKLLSTKLSIKNKLKIFAEIDDSDIIQLLKESMCSKDFVLKAFKNVSIGTS